jgi:MOSC domain-containing protein YiiM
LSRRRLSLDLMRLLSVQVGRRATYPTLDAADPADVFTSAIGKRAVTGPVHLGRLGLVGDEVVDTRVHGGPDQALLAYTADHFPLWRAEWGREEDLPPGSFGENLSVTGADETSVCVGDRWTIGAVVLEVTKPRSPCNTLASYQRRPDLITRVRDTGRSGWYLRVIVEGELEAGAVIERSARPYPELSVRRAALAMANRHREREEAMRLVHCAALAEDWRLRLAREGFRRQAGSES